MADRLLGIFGHQALEFRLGLFVFQVGRASAGKDCSKIRPGVRRAHIDDPNRCDARLRRLDPEQGRGLPTLDAPPELALSGDDQVLVERIGMDLDLNPLAAAGDHREDRSPCGHDPHAMLQLRHVFLGGRLFRERPRQHEFGLKHVAAFDPPVEGCRHPSQGRMSAPLLDISDDPPGIGLVPAPVKFLGGQTELHDQVAGQVLRLGFTAFLPPQSQQGSLVIAHDDPSVRAAYKRSSGVLSCHYYSLSFI